jgi:hypothetical protein
MTTLMEAKQQSHQITGISNVAFDLVTVLQNKLEGIAAIEEYKIDCEQAGDQECLQLFDEIQRRQIDDVQRLKGAAAKRLQDSR